MLSYWGPVDQFWTWVMADREMQSLHSNVDVDVDVDVD